MESVLVYRMETLSTPVRKQRVCEHGKDAGQDCYPCEGKETA